MTDRATQCAGTTVPKSPWRQLPGVLLLAALMGCGGGGGGDTGGTGANTGNPTNISKQDIYPQGERFNASAMNLMPLAVGDRWQYDVVSANLASGTWNREVFAATGNTSTAGTVEVRTGAHYTDETYIYVKDASGLNVIGQNIVNGSWGGLAKNIFQGVWPMREYDEPLLPQGKSRKLIREGSLGMDLDDDGAPENFTYTHEQIFAGFEPLTLGAKTLSVARYLSTETVVIRPTKAESLAATVSVLEETYLAPNFGPVRTISETRDGQGALIEERTVRTLKSARVGQLDWETYLTSDADVKIVDVNVSSVVFDRIRNVYYGIVAADSPTGANAMAIIDAATGKTSYRSLGSTRADQLAISDDANTLYVNISRIGEIQRLSLPSYEVVERIPQVYASRMMVQPGDGLTLAIEGSDIQNGAALVSNGKFQARPLVLDASMGTTWNRLRLLAANSSGTRLFFRDEFFFNDPTLRERFGTPAPVLLEYAVSPAGLTLVKYDANLGAFDRATRYTLLADMLKRNSDFFSAARVTALPSLPNGYLCRLPWDVTRAACTSESSGVLQIHDINSGKPVTSVRFTADKPYSSINATLLAWGRPGQVAIGIDKQLLLVNHPALQ